MSEIYVSLRKLFCSLQGTIYFKEGIYGTREAIEREGQ